MSITTSGLKTDGILKISSELFQPIGSSIGTTSKYIMDLSTARLRKLVDFSVKGECRRIFEIRGCLGHDRNEKFLGGKFREGWQAIVRIFCVDFLAKQATARHEPLLLEVLNAFINTRAKWDNEKEKLVREREALKEELNKAKEMAAEAKEMVVEAKQRMEDVRLEKEASQQGCQKELAQIHSLMKQVAHKTSEAPELKRELEAKQEELKRLQEVDKKIRQCLKVARRKGRELEDELKTMPAGIVVRVESKTLELIRSSKKWQISSYPSVFDPIDLTWWKSKVAPRG
ncbi:hypothetical protein R1flu_004452 [Riccia fluitans]|uniref:Uncharacterized protein n=1 Tax=Riccia fluitans TaxID=41844 RepID=A0ABD1YQC3_9MARC